MRLTRHGNAPGHSNGRGTNERAAKDVVNSPIVLMLPVLASVLSVSVACSGQTSLATQTIGPGLIVLHGASHVRTRQNGVSVLYDVDARYPASDVIQEMNTSLTGAGWSPLEYDVLDPKIRNSFDRGFTEYSDPSGGSGNATEKLQWNGQWRDRDGNVVVYVLRFDATIEPGGHVAPVGQLHISATRRSAAQIKAMTRQRGGGSQ